MGKAIRLLDPCPKVKLPDRKAKVEILQFQQENVWIPFPNKFCGESNGNGPKSMLRPQNELISMGHTNIGTA